MEDYAADRYLAWDGCHNIRDLGGLPTAGGSRIRRGALIRADNLCRLSSAGQASLVAHGVRTIVDLRATEELARASHPFAPNGSTPGPLTYIHIPVFDESDLATIAELDVASSVYDVYLVIVDRCGAQIASALRAIAHAEDGGVLIHCHVGKDRTGLVTALSLATAGVPDEEIVADYALSDRYLKSLYEEILAHHADDPVVYERLVKQQSSHPETMLRTLAYLDAQYEGVEGYLHGVGLADDDLERLRSRLLVSSGDQ
jgi:protein tyrosine/serine phosphatase